MISHGLFVGISNHNQIFIIFNDTIPLLMIALNILRFQSLTEAKPVDYYFLLKSTTILSICTCLFGLLAVLLGKPSAATVGNATIYLPLILSAVFCVRPFPRVIAISALIMVGMGVSEMNRTTLAFLSISVGVFVLITLLKKPALGLVSTILLIMMVTVVWASLSENSGIYRRIVGLYEIDLGSRTGSIGERQAEMVAVQANLDRMGPASQWLGMGFGGVYEVQFTHQYMRDYGHAHYSWVWYNLRYGRIGYVYLLIMISVLTYNAFVHLNTRDPLGIFIGLLCIHCLVFCVTYVNSIFLLSGVPFFYRRNEATNG